MKNILILFALLLFPLSSHCEIPKGLERPLNVEVRLGYEPNHFSPLKLQQHSDSTKVNKVKKEESKEEMSIGDKIFLAGITAISFYTIIAVGLFLILTLLGCSLLIIAKTIQIYRKKSK